MMGIWDWIWISGLVVIGSGVFAFAFFVFHRLYVRVPTESIEFDQNYQRYHYKINCMQRNLLEEHKKVLERCCEAVDSERQWLAALAREKETVVPDERFRFDHFIRELGCGTIAIEERHRKLISMMRDDVLRWEEESARRSVYFGPTFGKYYRQVVDIHEMEEDLVRVLTDQRKQLEQLSVALAANRAQRRHFEEALAGGVAQRDREETRRSNRVWFAAFAPPTITPGTTILFDIWAYTMEQSGIVEAISHELKRTEKVGLKAGIALRIGTDIAIEISIPAFNAIGVDHIVWDGEPVNASFPVFVPDNVPYGSHSGSATIAAEGLRIAHLWFSLTVGPEASERSGELPIGIRHFNSAFASYATSERPAVLARLQGIKKVAPDMQVFLDVMSLRSGDNWQEALTREVATKDVFYLFWSQAAAASEWVTREWSLALAKRGLDYIDPVPLQDPRIAPPPDRLSGLHFNDAYLAHIALDNQLSEAREGGQDPAPVE